MAHRIGALAAVALLVVAALAVAIATASRGQADDTPRGFPPDDRPVSVIAHRGASAYAPENTLPAVRLAAEQHADLIEIDVQQTRDGVVVLMHDPTLKRTTDAELLYPERRPWRVADFTYAEIRRLDAGRWFSADFAGVRVPTLREALDALEETDAGLLLEVKAPARYPGIARRIAEELDGRQHWRDSGRRLIVQSFDWGFAREFSQLRPKIEIGVLGKPGHRQLPRTAGYADLVNPQYGSVGGAYLRQVHALGMEAFVWTIDEPAAMRQTIAIGADGVITNRPDVLRGLLGGIALGRTSAGR